MIDSSMVKPALIITEDTKTARTKNRLQAVIAKKRSLLTTLTTKHEMLRMELELIKHEYRVRIGRLYLKDNELDIEIIRCKRLQELMAEGYLYIEAQHKLKEIYTEEYFGETEPEQFTYEEPISAESGHIASDVTQEVKTLWKQLLAKFHPDLVTDQTEKKEREAIMKKLNKAYEENDLETLKEIRSEVQAENMVEITIEQLEKIIIELENRLFTARQQLQILRQSEWYGWKVKLQKAKKQHLDVFKELERKLLDDIVRKIAVVRNLRTKLGVQSAY